jgi:hypothetical protein
MPHRTFLAHIAVALMLLWPVCVSAANGAITVSGTTILRDGKPWIPKGVVLVGRVAPAAYTKGGPYAVARAKFSDQELTDIARYGADLIRFQVSQGGSDPRSAIYSPTYVDEMEKAVRMARAHAFAVIVSLQSGRESGEDSPAGLPTDSTRRSWANLAPHFANDPGVMLELFNEPSRERHRGNSAPDPSWSEWRSAMQSVLDIIRRAGAHNVVIADGLKFAHVLRGAPDLSDPDKKVVYAVHPYPRVDSFQTPQDWDDAFGQFARTHPVLVTEWNAGNWRKCLPNTPSIATNFLQYAKAHRLGVVGWAYDFPGRLLNQDRALTSYRGFSCAAEDTFGAGSLLESYFHGQ